MPATRRGFLGGLFGAAATTPLAGAYVFDEPTRLVLPDNTVVVAKELPSAQPAPRAVRSLTGIVTNAEIWHAPGLMRASLTIELTSATNESFDVIWRLLHRDVRLHLEED